MPIQNIVAILSDKNALYIGLIFFIPIEDYTKKLIFPLHIMNFTYCIEASHVSETPPYNELKTSKWQQGLSSCSVI